MALYDPKEFPTETRVGADFTLADVLAWARTKPADEAYDYEDPSDCAVCQFLKDTGRTDSPTVALNHWIDPRGGQLRFFDVSIHDAALHRGAWPNRQWTFGAFADRLEKALAQ